MLFKNFIRAGFGGAGAQLINILALPLITRLYAPDEYAIWAIVMATASIIGSIACLRYELAIVIPKNEENASSIFWLCIFLSVTAGLIVFTAIRIPCIQTIITEQEGRTWSYTVFCPLLVSVTGISLALQYWNVRQRAFTINSLSQIALALVTLLVQYIYAIYWSATSTGLLLGTLAGQTIFIAICVIGFKFIPKPIVSLLMLKSVSSSARKQHKFLLYSTPYALFGMLRTRASLFVLDYYLGKRDVGLYAFSYRIMNFPVTLLSSALRPVLFKETAELGVKALEKQINNILRILVIIGTPLVVVYFFFADDLFRFFFGPQWIQAGLMGKFIILPVFTMMLCNWMDRLMDVLGQQRLVLFLEMFFASTSILGLWLGFIFNGGFFVALLIQCVILVVYNLCYLVVAYDKSGFAKKSLVQLLFIACGLSLCLSTVLSLFVE